MVMRLDPRHIRTVDCRYDTTHNVLRAVSNFNNRGDCGKSCEPHEGHND